ncbi:hydrogen peroxide-inducible genes activator [sulfur-oxidizing endosymbiont of Gigantopelta aegis]|uniref:hydrogen peroxide-inducible genes activator n=1 Tax=sulfur-oxidizing endosymbiont of Gigantopelta aegis TaxID=2794934 RepID=UPI0018DDB207|nr:hydrogen peroxide-inducible genes activator [sulfur-oxidizing endosymbiont of Gigantopelta aegis]
MRLPSLKHLHYLINVHKYQHFGDAAKACFVSQSTLSSGIAALENVLGVRLIERDNKKILFTPLAEEVVQQAQHILLSVEDLTEQVQSFSRPFGGTLKLGVIPTIAPFLIPQILMMIKQEFPELKVFVREAQSATVLQQLNEGTLDLVLLAMPYPSTGVVMKSFYEDRFYFAQHKDSQLNRQTKTESLNADYSNLEDHSLLLLEDGHCLRDHALSACHLQRSEKINEFAASSLHTLVQMVNNDLGVTFLPEMAIASGILNNTDIVTSPLADTTNDYREIGFAWRIQSNRTEEFEQLYKLVKKQISHFLPAPFREKSKVTK